MGQARRFRSLGCEKRARGPDSATQTVHSRHSSERVTIDQRSRKRSSSRRGRQPRRCSISSRLGAPQRARRGRGCSPLWSEPALKPPKPQSAPIKGPRRYGYAVPPRPPPQFVNVRIPVAVMLITECGMLHIESHDATKWRFWCPGCGLPSDLIHGWHSVGRGFFAPATKPLLASSSKLLEGRLSLFAARVKP